MTTPQRLIRVAVDAMGGDHAPREIVAGAVQASRTGDVQVILVGDPDKVQSELARHNISQLPIITIPSEGVITEDESPVQALRQKQRASIVVATGMVKEGHADACVSMGSTGATMSAAAFLLGTIEGIDRPSLGGHVLGLAPNTAVIDVGTNIDCRPTQLLNFAVIGDVFARLYWGVERPRIALLSVGAEASKGNRQVREAAELLAKSGLNFIGNIEANDLPNGIAEVVVCDGFVGNVVMKLSEGIGQRLADHLRTRLAGKLPESEVAEMAREVYELSNAVEMHGGGPLFGVNGVSIVGHGRAKSDAVSRAIGHAKLLVKNGFVAKLNEDLPRVRAILGV